MPKVKETVSVQVKIDYENIYDLIGQLLNIVDATFQDKDQRKAQVRLIKSTVYGWSDNLYRYQHPDKPMLYGEVTEPVNFSENSAIIDQL
jgi:hypothetical protein